MERNKKEVHSLSLQIYDLEATLPGSSRELCDSYFEKAKEAALKNGTTSLAVIFSDKEQCIARLDLLTEEDNDLEAILSTLCAMRKAIGVVIVLPAYCEEAEKHGRGEIISVFARLKGMPLAIRTAAVIRNGDGEAVQVVEEDDTAVDLGMFKHLLD